MTQVLLFPRVCFICYETPCISSVCVWHMWAGRCDDHRAFDSSRVSWGRRSMTKGLCIHKSGRACLIWPWTSITKPDSGRGKKKSFREIVAEIIFRPIPLERIVFFEGYRKINVYYFRIYVIQSSFFFCVDLR